MREFKSKQKNKGTKIFIFFSLGVLVLLPLLTSFFYVLLRSHRAELPLPESANNNRLDQPISDFQKQPKYIEDPFVTKAVDLKDLVDKPLSELDPFVYINQKGYAGEFSEEELRKLIEEELEEFE